MCTRSSVLQSESRRRILERSFCCTLLRLLSVLLRDLRYLGFGLDGLMTANSVLAAGAEALLPAGQQVPAGLLDLLLVVTLVDLVIRSDVRGEVVDPGSQEMESWLANVSASPKAAAETPLGLASRFFSLQSIANRLLLVIWLWGADA
mmetsp:Transcript_33899/g.59794  ORF Transcript_33899/g.59794 Transcript_33899/m.59794 type:complete len:148 (+) Transcript_33899:362-805(+)